MFNLFNFFAKIQHKINCFITRLLSEETPSYDFNDHTTSYFNFIYQDKDFKVKYCGSGERETSNYAKPIDLSEAEDIIKRKLQAAFPKRKSYKNLGPFLFFAQQNPDDYKNFEKQPVQKQDFLKNRLYLVIPKQAVEKRIRAEKAKAREQTLKAFSAEIENSGQNTCDLHKLYCF